MKINRVLMTPEGAAELLKTNTRANQRKMRRHQVRYLVGEIKRGAWRETGDAIDVGADGVLINGQHRLTAIVEAGIACWVALAEDVPIDSFAVRDRGLNRSLHDALGKTHALIADCTLIAHIMELTETNRVAPDVVADIIAWWEPTHLALHAGSAGKTTIGMGNASTRVGLGVRWASMDSQAERKSLLSQYYYLQHSDTAKLTVAMANFWRRSAKRKRGIGNSLDVRLEAAAFSFRSCDPARADVEPFVRDVLGVVGEIREILTKMPDAFAMASPGADHPYNFGKKKPATPPQPTPVAIKRGRGGSRKAKWVQLGDALSATSNG